METSQNYSEDHIENDLSKDNILQQIKDARAKGNFN